MTTQWKRLAMALAVAACVSGTARADVVVGSKLDTEATLLGNVILLALEANGIATEDRITLGGTPVVRKAITAGEIDIYPEYTGNAAFFFNKADDPLWKDHGQGYETAKQLDYEANKIVWLAPAPANNTWAIAVRQDVAEPEKLVTMSDFGRWVAGGGKVVLAGSSEFVNSAGALPSFQQTYGFTLEAGTADRAVRRRHLGHHQGRRRADQRRQCGHGLRHRRCHRGLGPRGDGGRQERPAGLRARTDHP